MPEPSNTLVWVDVETTGLDYERDMLLEVGMVATTWDLAIIDDFHCYLPWYHRMEELMKETPDQIVWKMHTENGLVADLQSEDNLGFQGGRMEAWMKQYEGSMIAGHTCNFDRTWMRNYFPEVEKLFHYRQFDLGTIKAMIQHWSNHEFEKSVDAHRSIPDCYAEIEEARLLRGLLDRGSLFLLS